jgi:hypothetical protein
MMFELWVLQMYMLKCFVAVLEEVRWRLFRVVSCLRCMFALAALVLREM